MHNAVLTQWQRDVTNYIGLYLRRIAKRLLYTITVCSSQIQHATPHTNSNINNICIGTILHFKLSNDLNINHFISTYCFFNEGNEAISLRFKSLWIPNNPTISATIKNTHDKKYITQYINPLWSKLCLVSRSSWSAYVQMCGTYIFMTSLLDFKMNKISY